PDPVVHRAGEGASEQVTTLLRIGVRGSDDHRYPQGLGQRVAQIVRGLLRQGDGDAYDPQLAGGVQQARDPEPGEVTLVGDLHLRLAVQVEVHAHVAHQDELVRI